MKLLINDNRISSNFCNSFFVLTLTEIIVIKIITLQSIFIFSCMISHDSSCDFERTDPRLVLTLVFQPILPISVLVDEALLCRNATAFLLIAESVGLRYPVEMRSVNVGVGSFASTDILKI